MTPTYPASVPGFLLYEYSESPRDNRYSHQPEKGAPIFRRKSTARQIETALTAIMTRTQLEIFKAFFENELADGALRFHMDHPVKKTRSLWLFPAGQKPYSVSAESPVEWRVSMTLWEVR